MKVYKVYTNRGDFLVRSKTGKVGKPLLEAFKSAFLSTYPTVKTVKVNKIEESFEGYDENGKPQFNLNYENSYFRGTTPDELKEIIYHNKWSFSSGYYYGDDVTTERESAQSILEKYPYFKSVARSFSTNTWRFSYSGFFMELDADYVKSLSGVKAIPTALYAREYGYSYKSMDRVEQEERLFSKRETVPVNPKRLIKAVYFFLMKDEYIIERNPKIKKMIKELTPQLKKLGIKSYFLNEDMIPQSMGDGDPYMQPEPTLPPYYLRSNKDGVKEEIRESFEEYKMPNNVPNIRFIHDDYQPTRRKIYANHIRPLKDVLDELREESKNNTIRLRRR